MTDNTQVNTGTGDTVRDIDRGSAKTQVVQLDAGGQAAESLVSANNPLPVDVLVQMRNALNLIAQALSLSPDPATGRLRVLIEASTATVPVSVASVTNLT